MHLMQKDRTTEISLLSFTSTAISKPTYVLMETKKNARVSILQVWPSQADAMEVHWAGRATSIAFTVNIRAFTGPSRLYLSVLQ